MFARLDQFFGDRQTSTNPVDGAKRLWPTVTLDRRDGIKVPAQTRETHEQFTGNERQIAGNHHGPVSATVRQCGMKSPERSPFVVHIGNNRKIVIQICLTACLITGNHAYCARDRKQCPRDAINERLSAENQPRFVSAHAAGCAAGENKTFKRVHGDLDQTCDDDSPTVTRADVTMR